MSDKFATPSLFGAIKDVKSEPQKEEEVTVDYPTDETDEEEQEY